jgi:hypothetical protein
MNERNMLNMILGGGTGGILITGTDAVTGSFDSIVVNEDAVFDEVIIEDVDVVADRGLTGATVTAGMYLGAGRLSGQQYAELRAKITSIKLVSGSVMAY